MGAWGTAIFSDDVASDIRDDYLDLLGDGHTGPQATDILLREWEEAISDPDDGPVFWLALATTQWKYGRLEERVKAKALQVIEDGQDLIRWQEDPRSLRKRRDVLARLKAQLETEPPPERRVAKRYKDRCDWAVGELIAYQLRAGRWFIFRVIGHHTDQGGTSPVVEVLDWMGDNLPKDIERLDLKVVREPDPNSEEPFVQFMLCRLKDKDLPADRVRRLGIQSKPAQEPGGHSGIFWKELDRYLKRLFKIRS